MQKAKDIFAVPPFPEKEVIHNLRYFVKSGKAATGPPIGQDFTKLQLKVIDFTKSFNDRTKPIFKDDVDLTVRIQVYFDRTYQYRIEPPPAAWFILRAVRKKRRETGEPNVRGSYACYATLEMLYEIAKIKQWRWSTPEYPPIETRVRSLVGQCRRMGVCVLGVDAPSSPVKGMSAAAYNAMCEEHRAIHQKQWEELRQQQLEQAPLIERIHRPNVHMMGKEKLVEGLKDPSLFGSVWRASEPRTAYNSLDRQMAAMRHLNAKGWFHEMSLDDMRSYFFNHRIPLEERKRQLAESHFQPRGRDNHEP